MFGVAVSCVALAIISSVQASNYYLPLIKDLPSIKDKDEKVTVSVLNLPVTFYTEGQYDAETDTTKYFVLEQCSKSTGGHKYAQLSIISPDNPSFNSSEGYPVIELSTCKDNWNASCVFATNYIWDIRSPIIFSNISWIYETESDYIYLRFRSYVRSIPITLTLTYTDYGSVNVGQYKAGVIPAPVVSNVDYEQLLQYIKSSRTSNVKTNDLIVFFFALCTDDWPDTGDYTLTITVVGDPSSPLSAFDLIGCPYSEFPDPADCTAANLDAIKDQDAAPLVDIQMKNGEQMDLTQGVYLTVYGEGGELDGSNVFLIDVTIQKND